ncbi:MAG: helicase-exonuclease AddAB subunit AddA [Oscillospiraceae bacterium]|nr:helicase-exonuclease AddAB subunit AddA [Oscillospiraceae bacterium]
MRNLANRIWNSDQLSAINSFGGNILVSAAAGSGKTAVLVERVIRMLTDEENPVDADRLLIVTFTRLAAAEMRSRINAELSRLASEKPKDSRLSRQLLLMERAHIGTIHSFCSEIVRENTSLLGLMPDPSIADEDEAADLSFSALEDTIEKFYSEGSETFSELSETLGGGRTDSGLSEAVLTLYGFISSLPHYEEWLSEKLSLYDPSVPVKETVWAKILFRHALSVLRYHRSRAKFMAEECDREFCEKYSAMFRDDLFVMDRLIEVCEQKDFERLGQMFVSPGFSKKPTVKDADDMLKAKVKAVRDEYCGASGIIQKQLAEEFSASEAEFSEDIAAIGKYFDCLSKVTLEYDRRFRELKSEKRLIDYTDLEQMTLSVLTEKNEHGKYVPSAVAKDISSRFDYILIDECQDINKVQDTIFRTISDGNNLFFVGDVKQSIYRFRQAMPELFLKKRREWPVLDETKTFPATIILGKNYRSRKNIAGAVNYIFRQIMSAEAAEIEYDESEMLIPEAVFPESETIRNEFLLIEAEGDSTKTEAEAVAERIYNMVQSGETISENGELRPVRYSDICILFRAVKGKAEVFLSALRKRGINCRSENDKGFISRPEVSAVIDVLKAADNPLLDIPLAGAMLSEMFFFSPDELAEIRAESRKVPLYSSVKIAAENGNEKAKNFIETLDSLRKAAAYERSDSVIERLYDLTAFPQVMRSTPEGELKLSNLRLLIKYASDREKAGSHGLSAFIRFINRLEERESDLKPAGSTGNGGNCVRIMSVHGSKGLEFPVVFLCGTGKQFRTERTDLPLLHPDFGFACPARDFETGARFTTVPQLALKHELRRYNLAEEMRILYVALTRPKENLVITCCKKDCAKYLGSIASKTEKSDRTAPFVISSAKCEADWILGALLRHPNARDFRLLANLGEDFVLPDETKWKFSFINKTEKTEILPEEEKLSAPANEELYRTLIEREKWKYPFSASEKIPAKAGVSALTHQEMHKKLLFAAKPSGGNLSGADRGTALHTFMQFCDFDSAKADPKSEIRRLTEKRFITEKQAEVIDPRKVKTFFESELYRRIENSPKVWRELRFLRGLPAAELGFEGASPEDKITVQGVADCVFEENGKLIVVDYKTDFVEDIEELRERYSAQLNMYKRLLSESLGKEVVSAIIWSFRFGKELEV